MKIQVHVTNVNPQEQHRDLKLNIVKNIRFRFYKPNPSNDEQKRLPICVPSTNSQIDD